MGKENGSLGICPCENWNESKWIMTISHLNYHEILFPKFKSLFMALHFLKKAYVLGIC